MEVISSNLLRGRSNENVIGSNGNVVICSNL